MKRKLLIVLAIVVLIVSVFPAVALAKDKADVKVWIRNSTGSAVELRLIDEFGNNIYKTVEPGVFEYSMVEGKYSYYASTACGNKSGNWNFDASKTLFLNCVNDSLTVQRLYNNICPDEGWYADDGELWFMSWTTEGQYGFSDPEDYLFHVTDGDYYHAWWGCWTPKAHAHYGW